MLDFRSKARQQLLAYYFTNPTARLHLRDLAERLSLDPSNLSKELGRLEREGLFRSEVSGRQKYFQLNREYPLFDEVRKIVTKTIGAAPLIAQSLKKIKGYTRHTCTVRSQATSRTLPAILMCLCLDPLARKSWHKPCKGLSGNSGAKSTTAS